MNFIQAIVFGFKNYSNPAGRASRSEYWYWTLFTAIGNSITGVFDQFVLHVPTHNQVQPTTLVFSLVVLVPSIAVGIRRLHDVNRTGKWMYIAFTLVGLIFPLLYWNCKKGTNGSNRFGDDPIRSATNSI